MSSSSPAPRPVHMQSALRRALGVAAVALLSSAGVLGVSSAAQAHDELVGTTVVVDPQTGAAQAFELTYSNSIIEVGTEIIVTGADGADATDGTPEIEGPTVRQPLASDLAAGEYTAAWRVVSSDGHPIEGAFGIAVEPDGTAEIVAAPTGQGNASGEAENTEQSTDTGAGAADEPASDSTDAGMPVGGIIAIVVGGVAVVAGGATAAIVANRRRAQGMAGDTAPGSDA